MGIQDSRDQNQVAKSRHLSMISGLGVITPLLRRDARAFIYIYARLCLPLTTIQTRAYCADLQNQTRQLSRLINGDIIYTTAALTQQGDHALAMCK